MRSYPSFISIPLNIFATCPKQLGAASMKSTDSTGGFHGTSLVYRIMLQEEEFRVDA